MEDKTQSIITWYEILGWVDLPNFSFCHHMPYDEFLKHYYVDKNLKQLESNVLAILQSGAQNRFDMRIKGNPGSGKTSFLYWLMKAADKESIKILSKYVFYIFHANRADDEEYRFHIREEMLLAWKNLYDSCEVLNIYQRIDCSRELNTKAKLNKLSYYFRTNRSIFTKTLVFIIDDVDLLDNARAHQIAESVKKDMELIQAVIWISIRDETFDRYYLKTKQLLKQFYSHQINIPPISTFEIMCHRIKAISNKSGKNPFSKKLCDETLEFLFSGNKRESIASLRAIISENLPKAIDKSKDERFIQNYIERAAIRTLIEHGNLPNLHSRHLRTTQSYPLAYDIIGCAKYSSNQNIIFGSINEIAIERCRHSKLKGRKFIINSSDFKKTLNLIENDNLMIERNDEILLTNIGKVLADRITSDESYKYYNSKCKDLIPSIDIDELYWELLSRKINHQVKVKILETWED